MRKCKAQKVETTYSTDKLMQNMLHSLVKDFRILLDDTVELKPLIDAVLSEKVTDIRSTKPTPHQEMTVAQFKAAYQIASVDKRHRYQYDIYNDSELQEMAEAKFLETQRRIAEVNLDNLDISTQRVLDYAALFISRVLGKYDNEECYRLCKFGNGASVGVPARAACEAARWELPISGSPSQIDWFSEFISEDTLIQEMLESQRKVIKLESGHVKTYQPIETLKLTFVPKSHKSLRAIMPNTTIGSFQSYGLGEMIRVRLKQNAYQDIRRLQHRHRELACAGSQHGLSVTADLSSASDSISVALVERLLPSDWFNILNHNRIGNVQLPSGTIIQSNTFCTMGIGYTFCLQTLIFLSLLKAIDFLHRNDNCRYTISVYGDDMIYPRHCHEPVVQYFERLGFLLNEEKTFSTGNFRESCGGDYYCGVDVRPFQPEIGQTRLRHRAYEAVLYKCINGLLMRWSEYEIERTLKYLMSEIERVAQKAKVVPLDFPDDAGIRCSLSNAWYFTQDFVLAKPKHLGHGVFSFSYLGFKTQEREELRHVPYYWAALRGTPLNRDLCGHREFRYKHLADFAKDLNRFLGVVDAPSALSFKRALKASIDPGTRDRLLKASPQGAEHKTTFVTISHTGGYTRQWGTSLFEDRS